MDDALARFLGDVLTEAQPPENPIVAPGWAGVAFDRNRYEDLAPPGVWDAWLATHRDVAGPDAVLRVLSKKDFKDGCEASGIAPTLDCLREYWVENANFLADHYVFSAASRSLVRLDQDVTLFVADVDVMANVVGRLGGLDTVMSLMMDDFQPGSTDSTGLLTFLGEIVGPLRGRSRAGS